VSKVQHETFKGSFMCHVVKIGACCRVRLY